MDFELPRDVKMLQGLVRKFVEQELIPIEMESLRDDEEIDPDLLASLQEKTKKLGLWHLEVPKEYGGLGLGLLARCVVQEEVSKTKALPFRHNTLFGPAVGPILYEGNAEQKERFLYPVLRGEMLVCFAQTEPDSGSDPAGMRTRAVRDGDHYVLNGSKRFITEAGEADYAQVICVTDPEKRARGGISCLMVDMKAPGVQLVRQWPTMMGDRPWEIAFDNVRVPVENRIGEEGQGFSLGQKWLTVGRVKGHGARCVGIAQRCLEMAMDYARQRVTFGQPLSERGVIQNWISDAAVRIHAARLMTYDCAWKLDQGRDVRLEMSMIKAYATEMAYEIVDHAMQTYGAMGMTRELPLQQMAAKLRIMRIYEGPTEVHRWVVARNLLGGRR